MKRRRQSEDFDDFSFKSKKSSNKPFVWKKKLKEIDGDNPKSLEQASFEAERRSEEKAAQLNAIRLRREEGKRKRELREQEAREKARENDKSSYEDEIKEEKEFLAKQLFLGSQLRLKNGRPHNIDIIYSYTLSPDLGIQINKVSPLKFMESMGIIPLSNTISEMESFINYDSNHKSFWKDAKIIGNWIIKKSTISIPQNLLDDIDPLFEDFETKKSSEIEELEETIEGMIDSGIDPEFWEYTRNRVEFEKSCVRMNKFYEKSILNQTEYFNKLDDEEKKKYNEKNVNFEYTVEENKESLPLQNHSNSNSTSADWEREFNEEISNEIKNSKMAEENENVREADIIYREMLLEEEGRLRRMAETVDDEKIDDAIWSGEQDYDEQFKDGPVILKDSDKKYSWSDKYAPRKPRYFNRVLTGYDWTKYNQTHYDKENPPPKSVHGYKFNIFYPELIDKTKTPSFKLVKNSNPNLITIRFDSGPPYEPIAFNIVNREWETNSKRGFRCDFDKGILRLYFRFRFTRYRR